jgi:hypothetical protein
MDMHRNQDFSVSEGTLTDTFDRAGRLAGEKAEFTMSFTVSGEEVSAVYTAISEFILPDETEVVITDEMKETMAAYVSFPEIDIDSISDFEPADDSPADTAAGTFRKRIVSRLNYREDGEDVYRTDFNDTESYVIRFDTDTFEYSNYSIVYTYNWKGDVGSMGACSYRFADGNTSSSCDDSTVETIQKVREYLRMELYYCGLSLEDLQAEANQEG